MASKTLTLQVRPRGKPLKKLGEETTIASNDSGAELYKRIAAQCGVSVHRTRITKGSDGQLVPNSTEYTIERTGLRDRSTIYVKDLGPQIAWRTVFIVEYLGPLLIHPLIYYTRSYLPFSPRPSTPPSTLQTLTLALTTLHFLKRELETLFVHRFSSSTMPLRNVFKNSAHYWLLAGLLIAYSVYVPGSSPAATSYDALRPLARARVALGLAFYLAGELGNAATHLELRSLRARGSAARGIPRGWGFGAVTCPNYAFETLAWIGMWAVSGSWAVAAFTAVAASTMAVWARKKERRYRREFGEGYAPKRWVMVPGVV
ncbi:3-oxo-5-alpha-steroid 4-dehydrogenase-domain-containing protein [Lineolata rhizophorae]|uniref:3-oxo-5-alpha-steroid 4-dehydrogenase-domain-containing protein n=1 Tax=Lineolata rhizophorae TaxID=578093 RepID=A0A6A6P989_9PEZI|nr:3-oxo-5-alpha-steroid 4-dehydrogenase-domain-containing protein [Lineolata rhizophorae]